MAEAKKPAARKVVVKTILDTFHMSPASSMAISDAHYTEGRTKMVLPDNHVGLELEIEKWANRGIELTGFMYKDDGSLRGSHVEAITYPTKGKFLENKLIEFFAVHGVKPTNYSERCSTHVHMNVQDMTFEQVKTLALIYQTVERLMFGFIGNDRENNIFCVPWHQSGVTANFASRLVGAANVKTWIKYCALNLEPAARFGTVEFRHMEGTCDVPRILKWVNLVSCLKKYAMGRTYKDVSDMLLQMNTLSNYDAFVHDLFEEHSPDILTGNHKELLSMGVIDSKLMLTKVPPLGPRHQPLDRDEDDEPPRRVLFQNPPVRAGEVFIPAGQVAPNPVRDWEMRIDDILRDADVQQEGNF